MLLAPGATTPIATPLGLVKIIVIERGGEGTYTFLFYLYIIHMIYKDLQYITMQYTVHQNNTIQYDYKYNYIVCHV